MVDLCKAILDLKPAGAFGGARTFFNAETDLIPSPISKGMPFLEKSNLKVTRCGNLSPRQARLDQDIRAKIRRVRGGGYLRPDQSTLGSVHELRRMRKAATRWRAAQKVLASLS